jgi:hypothetical protein
MILTYEQVYDLTNDGEERTRFEDILLIMKEVERLTREETRDDICNRLDDWVHAVVYPEAGE